MMVQSSSVSDVFAFDTRVTARSWNARAEPLFDSDPAQNQQVSSEVRFEADDERIPLALPRVNSTTGLVIEESSRAVEGGAFSSTEDIHFGPVSDSESAGRVRQSVSCADLRSLICRLVYRPQARADLLRVAEARVSLLSVSLRPPFRLTTQP